MIIAFFQGVGVAVLRGAVLYGLDPSVVYVRRAMKTYGIGIIKPFLQGEHPEGEKWQIRIIEIWRENSNETIFSEFLSFFWSKTLKEKSVGERMS